METFEEFRALAAPAPVSDSHASKIVELSKANKDLALKLDRERLSVQKLTKRVVELEAQANAAPSVPAPASDPSPSYNRELRGVRARLDQVTKQLAESRALVERATKDQARLRVVLAQEVGEALVEKALADSAGRSGGWRGRAQQIALLTSRVKDLERTLSAGGAEDDAEKEKDASSSPRRSARVDIDERGRRTIEQMESRIASERIDTVAQLTSELASTRGKAEAAVARVKALETRNAELKVKLERVIAKTVHDDELIAALRAACANAKAAMRPPVSAPAGDAAAVVVNARPASDAPRRTSGPSTLQPLPTRAPVAPGGGAALPADRATSMLRSEIVSLQSQLSATRRAKDDEIEWLKTQIPAAAAASTQEGTSVVATSHIAAVAAQPQAAPVPTDVPTSSSAPPVRTQTPVNL